MVEIATGVPHTTPSNNGLHELIGRIYEADADQEAWNDLLENLCRLLDCDLAFMACHDLADSSARLKYWHNISPDYRSAYAEECGSENPWIMGRDSTTAPGRVLSGDAILPRAELELTRFFEGFAEPLGIAHTLHARIARSGTRQLHLMLARKEGRDAFSPQDGERCQTLVSHMRRAKQLQDSRGLQHFVELGTMEALNRLSLGVFIVDASGQVVLMNEAAQAIVGRDDGLRLNRLRLEAGGGSADRTLNRTLKRTIAAGTKMRPGAARNDMSVLTVPRPSGVRPYSVMVFPFRDGADLWDQLQTAALVFVAEPGHDRGATDTQMLETAYSLTHAEARIAMQVAQGRKLSEIAKSLKISVHTARTHLKHIFDKTNVERQAELVCLLHDCLWLVDGHHAPRLEEPLHQA